MDDLAGSAQRGLTAAFNVVKNPQVLAVLAGLMAAPGAFAKDPSARDEVARVDSVMMQSLETMPATHQELVKETNRMVFEAAMSCFIQIHGEILDAQRAAGQIPEADLNSDPLFQELLTIGANYVQNGGDPARVGEALATYRQDILDTYEEMLKAQTLIRKDTADDAVTGGADKVRYKIAGTMTATLLARQEILEQVDTNRISLPSPRAETSSFGPAELEVKNFLFAAANSGVEPTIIQARLAEMEGRFKAAQAGNNYLSAADKSDFSRAILAISEVQSFLYTEQSRSLTGSGMPIEMSRDQEEEEGEDGEVSMEPALVADRVSKANALERYAGLDFMSLGWDKHENSWFLKGFLERFAAMQMANLDRELRAEVTVSGNDDRRKDFEMNTEKAWLHAVETTAESMAGLPDHVLGSYAGSSAQMPMSEYLSTLLSSGVNLGSQDVVTGILARIPLIVDEAPVAIQDGLRRRDRAEAVRRLDSATPCYMQGGGLTGSSLNRVCSAIDAAATTESTNADPRFYTPMLSVGKKGGVEFVPDRGVDADLEKFDRVLVAVSQEVAAEQVKAALKD